MRRALSRVNSAASRAGNPAPLRPRLAGSVFARRHFSSEDRDSWTDQQWSDWNELDELEKLRRNPNMYSSPVGAEEWTSDRLLDDAWVIDPPNRVGTVIWLHGIGEGMTEAQKIFEMITPKDIRVVIPKAPFIPITALDEDEQRTWFDLESCVLSNEVDEDYRGIGESAKKVKELLDEEIQLVPSERIVVAGFAQGGALALHAGLSYNLPLAGILSFAGYLPLPDDYPEHMSSANEGCPVLTVHGNSDEVVPIEFARSRYQTLKDAGCTLEMREDFALQHHTSEQTLFEVHRWFEEIIAKDGKRN